MSLNQHVVRRLTTSFFVVGIILINQLEYLHLDDSFYIVLKLELNLQNAHSKIENYLRMILLF